MKLRYTHRAREDLLGIWIYIATQSPVAADNVYDRIEERCLHLTEHPKLGLARPEIADDARLLIIDRWLVLYRMTDNAVQVVRILDSARDLTMVEWTPE